MPRVLSIRALGRSGRADTPTRVYVGRPTKWGNPFVIGIDGNRATCLAKHAEYLKRTPALLEQIHELRGKDLVCYCTPQPCHADLLLQLANEPARPID